MSRFDYVKYDQTSIERQDRCKKCCQDLEHAIVEALGPGPAKDRALAKLEESYMWIGKAIRDQQIERNGSAPLQEERKDG